MATFEVRSHAPWIVHNDCRDNFSSVVCLQVNDPHVAWLVPGHGRNTVGGGGGGGGVASIEHD